MTQTEGRLNGSAKAEPPALSKLSLGSIAKELAKIPNSCVVFLMNLNIPTSTIIRSAAEVSEVGLKDADTDTMVKFTISMLAHWKGMRATAKDKDKVNEMERALREMGQIEMADVVKEKFAAQAEIAVDDFPQ